MPAPALVLAVFIASCGGGALALHDSSLPHRFRTYLLPEVKFLEGIADVLSVLLILWVLDVCAILCNPHFSRAVKCTDYPETPLLPLPGQLVHPTKLPAFCCEVLHALEKI